MSKFLYRYYRYILALLIASGIYGIMSHVERPPSVVSDNCTGSHCSLPEKKSTLNDKKPATFIADVIHTNPGRLYRLILRGMASAGTTIHVDLAHSNTGESERLGNIQLTDQPGPFAQEFVFLASKKYNGIVLAKTDMQDDAEITLTDYKVTSLDIENADQAAALRPSIIGMFRQNQNVVEQSASDVVFDQLNKDETTLGQVFLTQFDSISGVILDIDPPPLEKRGGEKYRLELRGVDKEGDSIDVRKGLITSLEFTTADLEKFRQADGRFRFPLYARLEPGVHYFLGINNKGAAVKNNRGLLLKGAIGANYTPGNAVMRRGSRTYEIGGDLYFKVLAGSLTHHQGIEILAGSILEDLGKGKGSYVYKSPAAPEEILDLDSVSGEVSYDDARKTLKGNADIRNSYLQYKFDTVYPFKKFQISAQQVERTWARVDMSYSFDQVQWKEITPTEEGSLQNFKEAGEAAMLQRTLYLKVRPKNSGGKKYGIKDLFFSAELFLPPR